MRAAVRRAGRRAGRRVGRRGAVLTLKGIMCAVYGYSLLVEPPADTRGIRLLLDLLPLHWWAWAWMAAGCTAAVCAWRPQGLDWAGFPAVYAVVAPWSLGSLASWWLYDNPRGWAGAVVWGAFCGVAVIVAEWPEPPHPPGPGDAHES